MEAPIPPTPLPATPIGCRNAYSPATTDDGRLIVYWPAPTFLNSNATASRSAPDFEVDLGEGLRAMGIDDGLHVDLANAFDGTDKGKRPDMAALTHRL